jgi:hypothetical protein
VLLALEGVMTPLINNIPAVTVAAGVLIVLAIRDESGRGAMMRWSLGPVAPL